MFIYSSYTLGYPFKVFPLEGKTQELCILHYKFQKICNNSYFFGFLGQFFEKYLPGPTLLNFVIGRGPIGLPEKARGWF